MYHIEDTVSAIKEIQRMLRIAETGKYDNNTRKSVAELQTIYGITPSGKVDYETFEHIKREFKSNELGSRKSDYLFDPAFPYREGDIGDNCKLLNDALCIVLNDYMYDEEFPNGKYLNRHTINAANFLRKIFDLPLSDEIDALFVNRLLIEKIAIEIKRQHGL